MTVTPSLASAEEIHAYLVGRLNLALRRPGLMGGELGIQLRLDPLLMAERQPELWERAQRRLEERQAWTSGGVAGAFDSLLPGRGLGRHVEAAASVYAEFARARGWLDVERVLDGDEYALLRRTFGDWVGRDRTWAEVVAEFGPPSMLIGGTNPLYGKTLAYMADDPQEPMVFFHLWNGTEPGAGSSWPPAYSEPLLLAVRCGDDAPLPDTLAYTPAGRRLRPGPC